MKMVLEQNDIGTAVIEYLAKRGITVTMDQLFISRENDAGTMRYFVSVTNVTVPPKEGPYR